MPDLYTPIDGKPWPQERFARQAPTWAPSGVIGTPQTAYGNGPAALSFSVAGSVITVALAVFRGNARGFLYERTDNPWQSGQAAASGSDATAAYALNTNANPRRDRLVLRRDLAAGRVYPFILQGTPAATPTAPALTQVETGVWDTPLFSWTLAGSSSTSISAITDERPWVHPDGQASPLNGIDLVRTAAVAIGNTGPENQGFAPTDVVRDRGGFYTGSGAVCATMPANLGGKCLLSVGGGVNSGALAARFIVLLDVAGGEVLRANGYGEDVAHATRELWVPPGSTFGVRALQDRGTGRSITGLYLSVHLIGT